MPRTDGQVKSVVPINVEHSNRKERQLPASKGAAYSVYKYTEIEEGGEVFGGAVAAPENQVFYSASKKSGEQVGEELYFELHLNDFCLMETWAQGDFNPVISISHTKLRGILARTQARQTVEEKPTSQPHLRRGRSRSVASTPETV